MSDYGDAISTMEQTPDGYRQVAPTIFSPAVAAYEGMPELPSGITREQVQKWAKDIAKAEAEQRRTDMLGEVAGARHRLVEELYRHAGIDVPTSASSDRTARRLLREHYGIARKRNPQAA